MDRRARGDLPGGSWIAGHMVISHGFFQKACERRFFGKMGLRGVVSVLLGTLWAPFFKETTGVDRRARGDLPGGSWIAGHTVISRVHENYRCFLVVEIIAVYLFANTKISTLAVLT